MLEPPILDCMTRSRKVIGVMGYSTISLILACCIIKEDLLKRPTYYPISYRRNNRKALGEILGKPQLLLSSKYISSSYVLS